MPLSKKIMYVLIDTYSMGTYRLDRNEKDLIPAGFYLNPHDVYLGQISIHLISSQVG